MSLLVLLLPPRPRLAARAAGDPVASVAVPAEFVYVFSADGLTPGASGLAAPALLPKADRTVLLLDPADVSWHRVDVPKAAPARLRAALVGTMEELLLDDEDALHFALGPGAEAGRNGWVAVTHRRWLAAALTVLEAAGREVAQVLPGALPRDGAAGHFDAGGSDGAPRLVLEGPDGVLVSGLEGTLARQRLPEGLHWTATPAAAAAAEHFVGAPVAAVGEAEHALAAARGAINLRQFDLAARHRGLRALREGWRTFLGPAWRPVRVGLLALAALQLVGLNAWAWQQERSLSAKRQAMNELLRATHPGVRSVLDAPVQMQRESDRLRATAGRLGAADYEALLGAAAVAWPDGSGPTAGLRYEPGRLTLATSGWGEPQQRQFRERLRGAGYAAEFADGRAIVTPGAGR